MLAKISFYFLVSFICEISFISRGTRMNNCRSSQGFRIPSSFKIPLAFPAFSIRTPYMLAHASHWIGQINLYLSILELYKCLASAQSSPILMIAGLTSPGETFTLSSRPSQSIMTAKCAFESQPHLPFLAPANQKGNRCVL